MQHNRFLNHIWLNNFLILIFILQGVWRRPPTRRYDICKFNYSLIQKGSFLSTFIINTSSFSVTVFFKNHAYDKDILLPKHFLPDVIYNEIVVVSVLTFYSWYFSNSMALKKLHTHKGSNCQVWNEEGQIIFMMTVWSYRNNEIRICVWCMADDVWRVWQRVLRYETKYTLYNVYCMTKKFNLIWSAKPPIQHFTKQYHDQYLRHVPEL